MILLAKVLSVRCFSMAMFKEMTIRRAQPPHTMPSLDLNGVWLESIGFTSGSMVCAVFHDSCLTLTTFSSNHPPNPNANHVLVVGSKQVRGQNRSQLVLHGFLLGRYGFNAGDRVILHLFDNTIQITRISNFTLKELGA
jgi:hypothetical protein